MGVLPLASRSCIITGATGGIGFAIARRFAHEGAKVFLVGRDQAKLADKLEELGTVKQASNEHHAICMSEQAMLDPELWRQSAVFDACPKPDVLVNCAGISQHRLLARMQLGEIKEILETNLLSTIAACQAVSRQMMRAKTSKTGCIITISSLLGLKGVPGTSIYATSKAGLLGLTSSLAVEYAQSGIRVNAIVPGYISTPMTENLQRTMAEHIPLHRFGTVDEVADAAVFLAQNEYANNCVLNLDGGLSAV